tara:strand:+ start:145 stop:330 length:186 start_codon:yes stop_codon:yes gene_type:complete
MNDDLEKAEQSLFEELMTVILFLNANGMPLDQVKEMILVKVNRAFLEYEENNIREKWWDNK